MTDRKSTLQERYGEWALITGASAGIGEAFAVELARQGMNLILVARRQDRLEQLSERLQTEYNIEALPIPLDLTQDYFLDRIIEEVGNREVGMLINNAGFGQVGELAENDPFRESDMVKLNCWAPVVLTHQFIKPMKERRRGAVIIVSSVLGYFATPYYATYSATKAFDLIMGEALWYEMKQYNVDVLAVAPGSTDTEFAEVAGAHHRNPMTRTAEQVVQTTMSALGKKPSVVDGFFNKLITFLFQRWPRKMVTGIMGKTILREKGA